MGHADNMTGGYAFKTVSLMCMSALEADKELEKVVAWNMASRAWPWILQQCRCSQKFLRNTSEGQADTDLIILPIRSF